MARGSTELDSQQYDQWLSKNKKEKELRSRHVDRRNANDGIRGWHFGVGQKPVYTKDIKEYRRELAKRGLMLHGDVKKDLK